MCVYIYIAGRGVSSALSNASWAGRTSALTNASWAGRTSALTNASWAGRTRTHERDSTSNWQLYC